MNTWNPKLATLAAAAALGLATPALATAPARQGQVYQRTVHFGDLDIGSDHGATQLYSRLLRAARYVCGDSYDPLWLSARASLRGCEHESIERAVVQVDAPRLTAAYDRHYPDAPLPLARHASVTIDVVTVEIG